MRMRLAVALTMILAVPAVAPSQAQALPFDCSQSTVFVAQNLPTQLFTQEYGTGSTTFEPLGPPSGTNYNALGFNPEDSFLYAIDNANGGDLLRIHDDGSLEELGPITGGPSSALIGDFDDEGNFYVGLQGNATAYAIDVSTPTPTATTLLLEESPDVVDWAFIDGFLWGANNTEFVRVDPDTGQVDKFAQSIAGGGTSFGAAWSYGNGDLGISNNETGEVFRIRIAEQPSASPDFEVVSTAGGPDSTNNDGAACPGDPTDLSVEKAGPATVEPGAEVTWTITITNDGPGNSSGMTLNDDLPAGITGASTPTPGCEVVGAEVQCVLGPLAAGASTEVEIAGTMPATPETCVTNTVAVSANGVDPEPGNDSAGAQTCTRPPLADVRIAKSAAPPTVLIGGAVTYTLTVTNDGPDPAEDVQVTDSPPAGVTPQSASPSQGACSTPSSCDLGALAPGQSATIEIVATTTALGTQGNTATVTSPTDDPDPSNNTSSSTVQVNPQADLRIVKQASTASVSEGEDFFYTLTVRNLGPSTAQDVVVSDSIPAGVKLRSTATTQGNCTEADPVVCALGNLPSGDTATIRVDVTATATGKPSNTATVTSPTPDPDPTNNQDSSTVESKRKADLSIEKQASTQAPVHGSTFTYRLAVRNDGPSKATGVVVTDSVPDGLQVESVSSTQGSCAGAPVVVCELGALAPGAGATIRISVRVQKPDPATNGASVTSETPDPDPSDNTSNIPIDPARQADVRIAKSAGATTIAAGDTVVYGLVVTNGGPSDADDVTVTDSLPAGARLVSASSSTGSCAAGQPLLCKLGTLANGASATIRVEVVLDRAGTARNSAVVTSPTPDPDHSNNTGETEVTAERADLSIAKAAARKRVGLGGRLVYRLTVANAGPSVARGVAVTDPVPDALRVTAVRTTAGACEVTRGTLLCRLGDLAPGTRVRVTVTTRAQRPGRVANGASVLAEGPTDPTPGDNTARANVRVGPAPARIAVAKLTPRRIVLSGQRVGYRILVRNRGGRTAWGVRVCDRPGAGLAFVRHPGARLVRSRACWRIRALAPRRARAFTVTARVLSGAGVALPNFATARAANATPRRARAGVWRRGDRPRGGGVTG